jgi:16S rRNA pseudouridine516 synthase
VTLESPVADGTAEQFAKGVQLHNEKDLTKPAVLDVITPTEVRLTISEGRYHQVKRMFAAVGTTLWACIVNVLVRLNSIRNWSLVNTVR